MNELAALQIGRKIDCVETRIFLIQKKLLNLVLTISKLIRDQN